MRGIAFRLAAVRFPLIARRGIRPHEALLVTGDRRDSNPRSVGTQPTEDNHSSTTTVPLPGVEPGSAGLGRRTRSVQGRDSARTRTAVSGFAGRSYTLLTVEPPAGFEPASLLVRSQVIVR